MNWIHIPTLAVQVSMCVTRVGRWNKSPPRFDRQTRVTWTLPHGQNCLHGAVVFVCLAACGSANMFLMKVQ